VLLLTDLPLGCLLPPASATHAPAAGGVSAADVLAHQPAACRWHVSEAQSERLSYLDWLHRAEASHRRGERQRRCPGCGRFFFPWEQVQ
jgi:hypothetical protein